MNKLRIAAFGFRTLPPSNGAAGADKFAMELLPRIVSRGHQVIAYTRKYRDSNLALKEYKGVKIKTFKTTSLRGFDTLSHSLKCTCHIIVHNSADIVHIQNGGNSIWALPLRLFGKKVFISQDGVDWKRDKWPWYGKLYLKISSYLTAKLPNQVIFDNEITKRMFEQRFKKHFEFIPFGSEVDLVTEDNSILKKYGIDRGGYYLFVGRFIPDKGLHYLIPAFIKANTNKKLVLVGGSPNPSEYEQKIQQLADENVIFAGYVYGDDVNRLILNSYCYVQPSDVEGLSPVVLTVMGLGVPLIVSNIEENLYAVQNTALNFEKSNIASLTAQINYAENNYAKIMELARSAQKRALKEFNWEKVTEDHIRLFQKFHKKGKKD